MRKVMLSKAKIGYALFGFCLVALFVALFTPSALAQSSPVWQQVPITTQAMKNAGKEGGEGMQHVWDYKYALSDPDSNTIYLCTDTSQVWKSVDGGATWQRKAKGFYSNGGLGVGVSPSNKNLVFVAGGKHSGSQVLAGNKDGIYRTLDGGENWTRVREGGYGHFRNEVGDLFQFPSNGVIYAATFDSGILKSTNNGDSWSTIVPYSTTGAVHDIKLHPTDNKVFFVSSSNGYKKITDINGAITVNNIGSGLTSPKVSVINRNNPSIIHAINGNDHKIYRSSNGGGNFSAIFSNSDSSKRTKRLAISPANPNYMLISYGPKSYGGVNKELLYSHDGGNTWYFVKSMDELAPNCTGTLCWVNGSLVGWNNDSGAAFSRSPITFHPTNEKIALGFGVPGHIAKTTDGGVNWRRSNKGYTGGAAVIGYSRFAWDRNDPNRFALSLADYGGYLTEDGGITFRYLKTLMHNNQGAGYGLSFDPSPGSKVIVGAFGHNENGQILQVSRDNGYNWVKITNPDTEGRYNFVSFSPTNGNVVYASRFTKALRDSNGNVTGFDYIPDSFLSTDKGLSWTRITRNGSSVYVKAVYPKNGDIIYATGDGTIYKSVDRGKTWTAPYPTFDAGYEGIEQLAVDPNDPDRLYAASPSRGLYVVTPLEAKLRNENHGITKTIFGIYKTTWVAVDPNNSNTVYLARWTVVWGHSDQGVMRSTDKGESWHNITNNLAPINVGSLAVNPHNSYVYIGSFHGTWKLPPPVGSGDTTAPAAPTGLKVVQ